MTDDRENRARTATGGFQGIEMQRERTELNLEKAEETMIGIMIDVMIGIVAMTVTVTGIESMTVPVVMIQGEGIVLDPESAAGARIDTEFVDRLIRGWLILGYTELVDPWLG